VSCFVALIVLATLSITTGILRKRWLGLVATGLIETAMLSPTSAADLALAVVLGLVLLALLVRLGLVATASFFVVWDTLSYSPPLNFNQWYAGRAMIALLVPLALLVFGFYVSLGGRPAFGSVLQEQ
jgi:hypothetical protein